MKARRTNTLTEVIKGPRAMPQPIAHVKNLEVMGKNCRKNWELAQSARQVYGRVLARVDGEVHHDDKRSFNDAFGTFHLNMDNIDTMPAMRSGPLAQAYFENIQFRNQNSQNQLSRAFQQNATAVFQMKDKALDYSSSIGLVPNKRYSTKLDFDGSHQFLKMDHQSSSYSVFDENPCPVVGALATSKDLLGLRHQYANHQFYSELITDALVAMAAVSRYERDRTDLFKDHLQNPYVAKSRPKDPWRCYTSHAVISVYEGDAKVDYDLRNYATGGFYYHGLGLVRQISASMVIKTVTVRQLYAFDEARKLTHGADDYLTNTLIQSMPETMLAQEISCSMTYSTDMYSWKGDTDVKVVSVCSTISSKDAMNDDENTEIILQSKEPSMTMFEFGNGPPTQHIIYSDDQLKTNLFCHNIRVPAEVAYASCAKAVHKIVNQSTDSIRRGYTNIISDEGGLRSLQSSIRANQLPYNSRLDDKEAIAHQLQAPTSCSKQFGFMSYGSNDHNVEPAMCIRSALVQLICPMGVRFFKGVQRNPWAPAWDTMSEAQLARMVNDQRNLRFNDAMSIQSGYSCDLDLDEIMSLAAKPSAFDNEVYM